MFPLPQVWAGTDACEPVTWQECKLVPKDVKFIVPEIKCEPKQELWYHEPEEVRPAKKSSNSHLQTLVTRGPGDRHEDDEHVQLRGEEHLALHHADEAGLQADHVE